MAGNKKNYLLRLHPHIYTAIERWAQDELRSVNSHIEFLLRHSLDKAGRLPNPIRKQTSRLDDDKPSSE